MSKSTFKTAVLTVLALLLIVVVQPVWAKKPINTNWRGLAVKGYDVVSYFTTGQPTKGKKAHSYNWNGSHWRFSTPEHLVAFKTAPEDYAPQYGGY